MLFKPLIYLTISFQIILTCIVLVYKARRGGIIEFTFSTGCIKDAPFPKHILFSRCIYRQLNFWNRCNIMLPYNYCCLVHHGLVHHTLIYKLCLAHDFNRILVLVG